MHVQSGRSPRPRQCEICGLYLFSGQGSASPIILLLNIIFILAYLSTGDKLQLPSLGPIYLLPQILPERRRPREIFIRKMKGKCLSSVASSGWHGARRPYLVRVTGLSPCLIKGPSMTSVVISAGYAVGSRKPLSYAHPGVLPREKRRKLLKCTLGLQILNLICFDC